MEVDMRIIKEHQNNCIWLHAMLAEIAKFRGITVDEVLAEIVSNANDNKLKKEGK